MWTFFSSIAFINIIYFNFILINLWILISAAVKITYIKNKNLNSLERIKSDEFINSFIKEFVKVCKKKSLAIAANIVSSISLSFHLIGLILLIISFIKTKKLLFTGH